MYLEGIYAIWLRELKVFLREKERVISALFTPLLWILVFGAGIGSVFTLNGINYQRFIYPGILGMSVLFGSIFYGLYIIWDRRLDFLKEVLVAPVPRSAVFFGKVFGGSTDVLIQSFALLLIGFFLGFVSDIYSALMALIFSFFISICLVSLGLIIGASMKSPEGFNLVMSFVMWPMFMLSGALFPLDKIPSYLQFFVLLNPMSYGVDLLRFSLLNISYFDPIVSLLFLIFWTIVFFFFGIKSFEKMQL
jgi:ABC-2 type transport system permease protein